MPAFAGTVATFLIVYALCAWAGADASPAILAATLSVGLSRAPDSSAIAMLRRLVVLPVVAICGALVGALLLRVPIAGAVLFACAMAASVALRQFGKDAAVLGRTIALALIAMLIVPVPLDHSVAGWKLALLVLAAGAVAQACTWAASRAGAYAGWTRENATPPSEPLRAAAAGLASPSTRMALQMLVTLGLAFSVGMTLLAPHWPWVVLSAFIVCSGAIGRGDAAYKALLRVAGAIGGTLVAALVSQVRFGSPREYAVTIFAALFAGMWLRRIGYAYWVASATLIFALLQGMSGQPAMGVFAIRVLCIVAGAICGVAAAWFVLPIRTTQVVRRRIADAMSAMRAVLAGETRDLSHHAAEIERVAPPLRMHRRIVRGENEVVHPATWIERTHALLDHMRRPGFDRRHAANELRSLRNDVLGERPDNEGAAH